MRMIVLNPSGHFETPGFQAWFIADRWRISGVYGSNKRWEASLPPSLRGVWSTGVERNRTFYFAGYTGAAGIGLPTWIFALTMDSPVAPKPFYIVGNSEYDGDGIKDVVDLDGGSPELLQQSWYETDWDTTESHAQSGYWITTLYTQENGYWRRADGRHGNSTFPIFEKWSRWSGNAPMLVHSPPVPDYAVADRGNDPARGRRAKITAVSDDGIRVEPAGDCDSIWPVVVVNDSPSGRFIEVQDIAFNSGPLLRAIARQHKTVSLSGMVRAGTRTTGCEASVLWAQSATSASPQTAH